MWEVQVHEDGDVEIRKVPSSYKNQDWGSTILTFKDSDSLIAELENYDCGSDSAIEEAMQQAEGSEYEWIKVYCK